MTRLITALSFGFTALVAFVATAFAAGAVTSDDGSILELARPVFDSIMAGDYLAAVSLALVFAVALAKRYAPGKAGEWMHTDAGGALATFFMSLGGALATATMGGAPWQWGMLWMATQVAFFAAGGYVMVKKVIVEPLLKPLAAKAPMWAQPIFMLVFWIFDKKTATASIEAKATAAGDAAVAAKPSTGVNSIAGTPTDL
jgi:hypothetical protein